MSIFPTDTRSFETEEDITIQEYAWDFTNNDFLIENGKFTIVTGIEALKVWIYKALKIPKYKYMAYTQNYGNEFDELIGGKFSDAAIQSEIGRYLKESLLVNKNITGIKDIIATIDKHKLSIDFTASTVYGEVGISV